MKLVSLMGRKIEHRKAREGDDSTRNEAQADMTHQLVKDEEENYRQETLVSGDMDLVLFEEDDQPQLVDNRGILTQEHDKEGTKRSVGRPATVGNPSWCW